MNSLDLALVWPMIAGIVVCGIAAVILIVELQRLRPTPGASGATADPIRRGTATPSRTAIFVRFAVLDGIGVALLLWGVLRMNGMI